MQFAQQAGSVGERMSQWLGYGPRLSSVGRSWRNGSLYLWKGPNRTSRLGAFPEPTLVFHLGGAREVPVRSEARALIGRSVPGSLTIIPPGIPTEWDVEGQSHSLTLHIAQACFEGLLPSPAHRLIDDLRLECGRRDERLAALMGRLMQELECDASSDPLIADALIDSIVLTLMRASRQQRQDEYAKGGLSPLLLRRSTDKIRASIESGVSLQELADLVSLSRSHFCKAFRRSTGVSPHRYLLNRRLERARAQILDCRESLSEIALSCGFSSQAHFSSMFKASFGCSPLEFRKSHQ